MLKSHFYTSYKMIRVMPKTMTIAANALPGSKSLSNNFYPPFSGLIRPLACRNMGGRLTTMDKEESLPHAKGRTKLADCTRRHFTSIFFTQLAFLLVFNCVKIEIGF